MNTTLPPTLHIIDFETSGLMPGAGGRPTEVAIVKLQGGQVVDRFASLMNAEVVIPPFITQLTGITNAMVASAPPAAEVMAAACDFVGEDGALIAHNAGFDQKFWQTELRRIDRPHHHPFACTVLLSRRLYPEAPNHKLGTLVDYHGLPRTGQAHRALADAEMTAALVARICDDLHTRHGLPQVDHPTLLALQSCGIKRLPALLHRLAQPTHQESLPCPTT